MPFSASLKKLIRRDAERPSLRERAAELQARIPARPHAAKPATSATIPGPAAEPDPALSVATVFRASWDALEKVLNAEAPDDLTAGLEDAQGAAYGRLRAVRPTTPEGYRALAECWALVLKEHRGDEPGMMVGDHAADSLIAGAGACVPAQSVDWYDPPPGFMASPAIEPMNFARVSQGLQIELQRLRGIAWAEYHRLTENLGERMGPDELRAHRAQVRAELFLPALTAAVDFGSVEAQVLAALGRPAGPDPVLALIEEHRTAYAAWRPLADVQGGTLIGSPEHAAASAAEEEPSRAEIDAYKALFSARPTTLPGTLALAEYLREAVREAQIEPEPGDGERALSVVADALRTALATREEWARRETSLVDMLDLTSASLDELQSLHDIADLVGGVAYATVWTARCKARGHGDNPNAAGKLMQWLGDALTDVETAANNEARRRRPADQGDRETRLKMLALPAIQNGDLGEIEAFARELLAHAAAERRGR